MTTRSGLIYNLDSSVVEQPQNESIGDAPVPNMMHQEQFINQTLQMIHTLPEFSGNADTYSNWRTNAISLMNMYKKGSQTYSIALAILKSKITNSANEVLNTHDITLNFENIIETLDLIYLDNTPIHILEQQLNTFIQGHLSLTDFYNKFYKILHLIINKIKILHNNDPQSISILSKHYKQNALKIFIKGLNQPLNTLLLSFNFTDLTSAFKKAQELEFDIPKSQYIQNTHYNKNKTRLQTPIRNNLNTQIVPQNYNFQRPPMNTFHTNTHIIPQNYNYNFQRPPLHHMPYYNYSPYTQTNQSRINNIEEQVFLEQNPVFPTFSNTATPQTEI